MVSVISENPSHEKRNCLSVTKMSKHKRRRVSAVRDFPSGCGSNAQAQDLSGSEVAHADDMDRNGFMHLTKSETDEVPTCSIGVEKENPNFVEVDNHELVNGNHGVKQFSEESGKLKSEEVEVLEAPELAANFDKAEINPSSEEPPHLTCKLSSHLDEEKVDEQMGMIKAELGFRDRSTVIVDAKQAQRNNRVESGSLPSSSTVARKERNYLPRRRTSALRDFPSGCRSKTQPVGANADNGGNRRALTQQDLDVGFRDDELEPVAPEEPLGGTIAQAESDGEVKGCDVDLGETEIICCGRSYKSTAGSANNEVKNHIAVSQELISDMVTSDADLSLIPFPFDISSSADKGARTKVRETLRLFQALVRKLTQEAEGRSKGKGNIKNNFYMVASTMIREKGMYLNNEKKIVGAIPGVEVGDEFHYRVELMMIGLHRQPQGGIDYVRNGEKLLATSVVASGGYDNIVGNTDELIYTGQGGIGKGGDKQPEDQKLKRGNLALANSCRERNFVRVIRGHKEPIEKGKMVSTYTYDGLYVVEHYWSDLGPQGKIVYRFRLRRCHGQREIVWKEVKKATKSAVREGCCVDDISGGKEKVPICAVNTIDDKPPPQFTYIAEMMYPDWCSPIPPRGCDCKNGCSDSEKCACAVKNGGEIPFNNDGAIVEAKPLVYECGPLCNCPPSCRNRVSQHGIQFRLEIFKTEKRGWGVRSLSSIPSGSFICEYVGELLDDREAENRTTNDEYLFDIGQNYNDHGLWEGLSTLMPDASACPFDVVEDVGFTIDALKYGSIGRFINHSCSPNLYAQNVLFDHEDRRIPHIMLFAAENIPPLQEITYHYNYTIDQVRDADGSVKRKYCYCGSVECTGRMY